MKNLARLFFVLCFSIAAVAQPSPYSNALFAPVTTLTATGQTSAALKMAQFSASGGGFSLGTITLTATSITTVTFGVLASSDNGVNYYPALIWSTLTPGTQATTVTATAAGQFQFSLATVTNIKLVTSGTFTASGLSLVLTATPAPVASNGGHGSGGGAVLPASGVVCAQSTTVGVACTPSQILNAAGISPVLQVPPFVGDIVPVFQNVNSFDNLGQALGVAFCLAPGGGLVACTEGTPSTGYRRLPREANSSRVTRTDWLVTWDPTDTTGSIILGIGPTGTSKYNVTLSNSASGTFQAVFNTSAGTTSTVSGAVGTNPINLSVSIVTGNGGVTVSVHPLGAQISPSAPNNWNTMNYVYQHVTTGRITMASFSNSSTTSVITGWLHNTNGLDGDPNGVLLTRTAALNLGGTPNFTSGTATTNVMDHENFIIIPERPNPSLPLKIVWAFHGRTGYAPGDFCGGTVTSAPGEPEFKTCVDALSQGYAFGGDQGGTGFTNGATDYWGNIRGTEEAKQSWDFITSHIYNPGKMYALGQSMGGAGALNFIRTYPNLVAAAYLATPAIDLNETTCPLGINCAGGTLQSSLNTAYRELFISMLAGNINNNPATDNGTNWTLLAEAGALPDVGGRSWQKTTVTVPVTNATTVALTSTVGIQTGDYLYFERTQALRKFRYGAVGVPGSVILDSPVTISDASVTTPEQVMLIHALPNGEPDPTALDFNWILNGSPVLASWSSLTTYGLTTLVYANSSNPFNDEIAWNPQRSPESYGVTPVEIGIGGDGTCTGNDGILNNIQMCAFGVAVNAIYPGLVTNLFFAGINGAGHVTQAMNAGDIMNWYNAN